MGTDKLLTLLSVGLLRFVFVREGTNKVLTRYGRYSRTLKPGLRCYLNLWGIAGTKIHEFEITDPNTSDIIRTTEVDMKEIVYDYAKERVISADNVQFEVNAVIYFRVFDPYKALFSVEDYTRSLRTLAQSILRAEIGKHPLERSYTNRNKISESLAREADEATDDWGIRVTRLEIKEFEVGDFAKDMLRQKQQDIEKRQQILQAEAQKESGIQIAEGKKISALAEAEATKLRAEADAEATKMRYEAEAAGYKMVAEVLRDNPELADYLKYHTAETVSKNLSEGQATKLFLPAGIDQLLSAFTVTSEVVAQNRNGSQPEWQVASDG